MRPATITWLTRSRPADPTFIDVRNARLRCTVPRSHDGRLWPYIAAYMANGRHPLQSSSPEKNAHSAGADFRRNDLCLRHDSNWKCSTSVLGQDGTTPQTQPYLNSSSVSGTGLSEIVSPSGRTVTSIAVIRRRRSARSSPSRPLGRQPSLGRAFDGLHLLGLRSLAVVRARQSGPPDR